jgi:hypothetical protein
LCLHFQPLQALWAISFSVLLLCAIIQHTWHPCSPALLVQYRSVSDFPNPTIVLAIPQQERGQICPAFMHCLGAQTNRLNEEISIHRDIYLFSRVSAGARLSAGERATPA